MHFLHIADVHFGCEYRKGSHQADISIRNNYMKTLTDAILAIHSKKKLDFILLTGDIAWSASPKEYGLAETWLKDLLKSCGLDSKHLFVCPGNHDIDRDEAEEILYPDTQKIANQFLQVEKLHKLQRRFSAYVDFCSNMELPPYQISQKTSQLIGLRDMGDFRIVCINTAWYAKNDEVKDKMWIGAGFSEILKEQLSENQKPTITIMHHPRSAWHEQECSHYDDTTNVYADICFFSDLVLTGHCHEISNTLESSNKTLIGGTGALFERNNYTNCFYTYEIDFSRKGNQKRVRHFWHANSWHQNDETFDLLRAYGEKPTAIPNLRKQRAPEDKTPPVALSVQSNLYSIANQVIQYVPIIGSWNNGEAEYYYGDFKLQTSDKMYQLPEEILKCFHSSPSAREEIEIIEENVYEEKVRFDRFNVHIKGGARPHFLHLQFSKATYRDFLIVKTVIDQKLSSGKTIREKYLSETNALVSQKLPNVCGVGIFIITSDNKLIVAESSPFVLVNPEKYIYSASGSMNWNGSETNPFDDIIRECKEEIGYTPSIEGLKLYSIGMDYATGYYQFSFYERSNKTAAEIVERAQMARDFHIEIQRLIPIEFTLDGILDVLTDKNPWDETAKANLFTLAVKNFGIEAVKRRISPYLEKNEYRRDVTQMWKMRAQRTGRLPVLSSRYPAQGLERSSNEYIDAVLRFIDEDLSDKSILEIGGGIGLFTKHFAQSAKDVTCIDVCEEMIRKNKRYLGAELAKKVNYVNGFFQDYETDKHFDILICSLVLIHNAPELNEITKHMKQMSDVIYLFEHTDQQTQVGMYTDIKTAAEYIALFPEYIVEKQSSHMLCQDKISFIKLRRKIDCTADLNFRNSSCVSNDLIDVTNTFAGQQIQFRSMENGKYLSADSTHLNAPILCNRDNADLWETFTVAVTPDGYAGFQAHNGKWLSARYDTVNVPVYAIGERFSIWERFKIYKRGSNYFLHTQINELFLCVRSDFYGAPVQCHSNTISNKECFQITVESIKPSSSNVL